MAEDQKPDEKKDEPKGAPAPAQKKPQVQGQQHEERPFDGYLTEVVEVSVNRTGIYGEIKQAMCKVLEGKDRGRVIRRNIAGKIKVGDMLRLPDTTREDKPIRAR
jgi:small subunit ribosomal protein S28e